MNQHDVVLLKDNQGWKYNVAACYVKRQLIDYKTKIRKDKTIKPEIL